MRTIQMEKLPNCDICKREGKEVKANYDSKTVYGPHAYLCEDCFKRYGCPPSTKLEKRVKIAAAKTDEVPVVSIPIWESATKSVIDVKCPHCGEKRAVEPDANYVVTCESCGNRYEVVSEI